MSEGWNGCSNAGGLALSDRVSSIVCGFEGFVMSAAAVARARGKRWVAGEPLLSSSGMMDYYALLDVDRDATADDIVAAYRAFNVLAHPSPGDDGLAHIFSAAQEAHDVLTDPVRRAAYDAELDRMLGSGAGVAFPRLDTDAFPSVCRDDIPWLAGTQELLGRRRVMASTTAMDPLGYGREIVADALSFCSEIDNTVLFTYVPTPFGAFDHVLVRNNGVVVVSSVLLPVDDEKAAEDLGEAVAWFTKKVSTALLTPKVKVVVVGLPDVQGDQRWGSFSVVGLKDAVIAAGEHLIGSKNSLYRDMLKKKVQWLKKN